MIARVRTTIFDYLDSQTVGMSRAESRIYLAMVWSFPFGALCHCLWAILFLHLDTPILAVWNVISGVAWCIGAWMVATRRGFLGTVVFFMLIEVPAHAVLATYLTGLSTGFWAYLIPPLMGLALWQLVDRRKRILTASLWLVFFSCVLTLPFFVPPTVSFSSGWTLYFFLTNVIGISFLTAAVLFVFEAELEKSETALSLEYERAEGLLRNILPEPVARRLKDNPSLIAQEHPEVSILFADIVNFTEHSAPLPAGELIRTLNRIFSRFDDLAVKHGVEKIKTIGDAYMVVAGLPEPRENHAEVMTRLALDMLDAATEINGDSSIPCEIRIGINSGPVVAGVIGHKKFAYDLWGDAVNIASRMEAHSAAGRILITETTRARLPEEFDIRPNGHRDVKGRGRMPVYSVGASGRDAMEKARLPETAS